MKVLPSRKLPVSLFETLPMIRILPASRFGTDGSAKVHQIPSGSAETGQPIEMIRRLHSGLQIPLEILVGDVA
jgi:hypothetical protein